MNSQKKMNSQTKVYVGNLPENCTTEALRSLFEKQGKVVECDIITNYAFVHFADGEDARLAVGKFNNTKWDGVTLKVEQSHSKVRQKPGMGVRSLCYRCGKPGHWLKDCPKRPSQGTAWNDSNNSENRDQSLHGNWGPYMNGGSSGSSGGFLQNGPLDVLNGYRNDSFRDSYREPLLSSSSSSYYERNNSNSYSGNSSHYHNSSNSGNRSNNNTNIGLSRDLDRDHSLNDPYYDSYPPAPPPPPPTRYRPYPSAIHDLDPYFRPPPEYYERRRGVLLPGSPPPTRYERQAPLPGTSKPLISSLLSSSSSLSHYHQNNNNHYRSSSPTSHNNNSSIHDRDPYFRPPPEYYE